MSIQQEGFALTAKAHAFLLCNPSPFSTRCGCCGRSQRDCTRAPCPTRLEAVRGD